jgi:hypothetical protein
MVERTVSLMADVLGRKMASSKVGRMDYLKALNMAEELESPTVAKLVAAKVYN